MDETPDFEALARLWLGRDPRSENLPQDAREKIVARLAEALKKRRSSTDHAAQDVGLVVNIDRESIVPGKGLAEDAIEQLTEFLQERIDNSEDL